MNTCKVTLRILIAHRLYVIIYLVMIGVLMFGIGWSLLTSGTGAGDTYAPSRPTVAVIDRDDGRGGIADAMRDYMKADGELVSLQDDSEALQQAVASNYTDLIVIIPDGYADALLDSVISGTDAPQIETVTSYTSGDGTMASMEVSGFLALTRTALIGDGVQVGAADFAEMYGDGAGSSEAGMASSPQTYDSRDASDLDQLPEGTVGRLTRNDLARAARSAVAVAKDGTVNHAIAVNHTVGSDVAAGDTAVTDATVSGFGGIMKTVLYPLFLAMTVCTALVCGVFNAGETSRRLSAAPRRASITSLERMATMCGFALAVSLIYLIVTFAMMLAAGLSPLTLPAAGVAMTFASTCVYALMTVACGFMLGELGFTDTMANGFANLFGLLILFTSGVSFPPDMMPDVMRVIARFLPGWWYCVSIDNALGFGTVGGVNVPGWAESLGLVLLFAVTFMCLGLAAGRIRRARRGAVSQAATVLAEA
ncbi:ABC transporter permease [Bifidobacterium vansinderenii]|uniref:Multidrug permease ABC transporter n=1 Tax=Bifidobacterium vansinderenii TaxID=1984871 RepID=A0A229W1H8_9BIFI|nr:ABC transporter permease [Bifidobacterium vansinderenii]OXN01708.1 multidrug permease ABC transporter [Bifidobacterium vansinderenii]